MNLIGVDGRELESKPTGVGIYLRNILERLSLPSRPEIQLFFKQHIPSNLPATVTPVLLKSNSSNLVWQQWHLCRELRRRKVSLFFSPANTGPWYYRGINIITLHDLSFFLYPQWFSTRERITRQINTSYSLRQADRIYTVSPFVRDEIVARFNIQPSKIVVTGNGVVLKLDAAPGKISLLEKHSLSGNRVILFVGSVLNRRRIPLLMEAFASLDHSCVLIVIGENRTYPHEDLEAIAARFGVRDRVRLLNYVEDALVDEYYRMADVFVYLSEYEGFGIPPLEAMSYGIPVVISKTPHMNRIFDGAACFVDSFDAKEVAAKLDFCLKDEAERKRLTLAGRALAERYNWDQTARIVSEDWEQLLARR
jgi:glycosyltransferase involved in cell wall biosynthesis